MFIQSVRVREEVQIIGESIKGKVERHTVRLSKVETESQVIKKEVGVDETTNQVGNSKKKLTTNVK